MPCFSRVQAVVLPGIGPVDKGEEMIPPGVQTGLNHQMGYTKASAELGGEAPLVSLKRCPLDAQPFDDRAGRASGLAPA